MTPMTRLGDTPATCNLASMHISGHEDSDLEDWGTCYVAGRCLVDAEQANVTTRTGIVTAGAQPKPNKPINPGQAAVSRTDSNSYELCLYFRPVGKPFGPYLRRKNGTEERERMTREGAYT